MTTDNRSTDKGLAWSQLDEAREYALHLRETGTPGFTVVEDLIALVERLQRPNEPTGELKLHREFLRSIVECDRWFTDDTPWEEVCKSIENDAKRLDAKLSRSVHEIDSVSHETDDALCTGCGLPASKCVPIWTDMRKCCPDCSHCKPKNTGERHE